MTPWSRPTLAVVVTVIIGLALSPASPSFVEARQTFPPVVSFQDPSPPVLSNHGSTCANDDAQATAPATGAQLGADGRWFMVEGASQTSSDPTAVPQTSGGPDEFGYTWSDAVPLNWIDASGGINTGLTGDSGNQATGLIALPFSFKFYENSYSSLYIAASGYLAFTSASYWSVQSRIPIPSAPNNVIAPYWTPIYIGAGAWVRYLSGGTAPNRYFVVEWHDVTGGGASDTIGADDRYRFEVVLYENGDILFQYQNMTVTSSYWCGAAGIEDTEGLDGLATMSFCARPPAYKAVRFYRPAPAARIQLRPAYQGGFGQPGSIASYQQRVRNTGDIGSDTLDLTVTSPWPATLYRADGVTPLSDTDGDGVPDIGSVPQGGSASFVIKVQIPSSASLGEANPAAVRIRSSRNTGVQKTATFQTAIPAGFAQVFRDNADGAQSFYLVQPTTQRTTKATSDGYYGYYGALAQLPNGGFVYAWSKYRWTGSVGLYEIEYVLLNSAGDVTRAISRLTDHSAATTSTYDYEPVIAATPDGNIGFLWYRAVRRSSDGKYNYNIYFALLNSAGNVVVAPTNLTNNPYFTDT